EVVILIGVGMIPHNWKRVANYLDKEEWKKARELIKKLLKKPTEDDHWLFLALSRTYYMQSDSEKGLIYIKKALSIAPKCPSALFEYADILYSLERIKEAIEVYQRLINRGVKSIACGDCGEGLGDARGMQADCYHRIAECYEDLHKLDKTIKYYKKHISLRGPGCYSMYSMKEVRNSLKGAVDELKAWRSLR
ncbi:tetratricopeptide repeat protein, partial [Planctomycetota bacterium]